MPKKLTLQEVERRLPPFVTIKPETYKGVRYKAEFTDIEYQEDFRAVVAAVISLQHGCSTRSNDRKRAKSKGKPLKIIPLEDVQKNLPPYLEIVEESYRNKRSKATFYDTEYDEYFEGIVANVLRHGKGYGPSRQKANAGKPFILDTDKVQERLDNEFCGKVILLEPDQFKGILKPHPFEIYGKRVISTLNPIESGRYFLRQEMELLKKIKLNDAKCICGHSEKLEIHHIIPWAEIRINRLNLNNLIPLCHQCHEKADKGLIDLAHPDEIRIPNEVMTRLWNHKWRETKIKMSGLTEGEVRENQNGFSKPLYS